jgi:hypothetical protein
MSDPWYPEMFSPFRFSFCFPLKLQNRQHENKYITPVVSRSEARHTSYLVEIKDIRGPACDGLIPQWHASEVPAVWWLGQWLICRYIGLSSVTVPNRSNSLVSYTIQTASYTYNKALMHCSILLFWQCRLSDKIFLQSSIIKWKESLHCRHENHR